MKRCRRKKLIRLAKMVNLAFLHRYFSLTVPILVPANIYDFITSLPQGFDTQVGGKGSQLSGGQKREPRINSVWNPRCSLHGQSALPSLERFSGILKCYFWMRSATTCTALFLILTIVRSSGNISTRLNVGKSCAGSEFFCPRKGCLSAC